MLRWSWYTGVWVHRMIQSLFKVLAQVRTLDTGIGINSITYTFRKGKQGECIYMCMYNDKVKWKSLSRVWLFMTPWNSAVHGILQGRILEWVAFPFLRQGIFPTQGLSPGLLHCRRIPYQLSHKGSPRIMMRAYSQLLRLFCVRKDLALWLVWYC